MKTRNLKRNGMKILLQCLVFSGAISSYGQTAYPRPMVTEGILGAQSEEECWSLDLTLDAPSSKWQAADKQGDAPWCGAIAQSDVLTFELGHPVSGLYIGAIHFEQKMKELSKKEPEKAKALDVAGGYNILPCDLTDSVNENGYCEHSAVEGKGVSLINLERQNGGVAGLIDRAASVAKNQCVAKVQIPKLKLECGYYTKNEKTPFSGMLDALLTKGFMPLLTFNQKAIYTAEVNCPDFAPHTVPIIGRRWNSSRQRCEYKVRNSVPLDSCDYYNSSVSCYRSEVKFNQIWIAGNIIDKNAYNITVIYADRERSAAQKRVVNSQTQEDDKIIYSPRRGGTPVP